MPLLHPIRAVGTRSIFRGAHKLMRRYTVTNAAVHDSQTLDALLDPHNTASEVWADTAYRSKETEEKLAEKGLRSRIHRRARLLLSSSPCAFSPGLRLAPPTPQGVGPPSPQRALRTQVPGDDERSGTG